MAASLVVLNQVAPIPHQKVQQVVHHNDEFPNKCVCPTFGYCDRLDRITNLESWERCQKSKEFREASGSIRRRYSGQRPIPVRIEYENTVGLGDLIYRVAKLVGLSSCIRCKIRHLKLNKIKLYESLWRFVCNIFPRIKDPIPKPIMPWPWMSKEDERLETNKPRLRCCMAKPEETQVGKRGPWRRKGAVSKITLQESPSAIQISIKDSVPKGERLGIIGITTSPVWNVKENRPISNRNGLKPLVESLIDTGWSTRDVVVFAEPYANSIEGVRTVRREIRLGSWKNWFEGLKYLRSNYPNLQYYMMLQDDIIFCKKVREYVDTVASSIEFKDWGVLSLYLSERYGHGHTKGINRANVRWHWGACAYVFPPVSVDKLLLDGIIHQHTGNKVDVRIGAWALRSERGLYYNYPSLTQHRVNIPSSIAHGLGKGMKSSSFSPEYTAKVNSSNNDNNDKQISNVDNTDRLVG